MTKVIGHRGARGLAPENTLAAIAKGLESGVDLLEIDVRVTRDSVPILAHDKSLPSKPKLTIADHTYKELQTVKPDLTTLDEAVRFIAKRVPLMIEVKPGTSTEPVIAAVQTLLHNGWRTQDFLLGSKSQRTLRTLQRSLPQIHKVVIERFLSIKAMLRARQVNTRIIAMNQHFLWFGFVGAMHRRGYELLAYTLNDVKKAKRWYNRGLGGVITDHPEYFTGQFDDTAPVEEQ